MIVMMNSLGPKAVKKVIMSHKLAKALMEEGVQHYDSGGMVYNDAPQYQNGVGAAFQDANKTADGYGNAVAKTGFNSGSTIGNGLTAPVGGFMQGVAANFTTQNNYQAQNPYDPSVLQNAYGANQTIYGQQQGLASQLQAQAEGQGPSVSQTMLNHALQQQQGASNGIAAANRGINSGLAMRQALQAQSAANAQSAALGVAARQQEQLNAQGQLQSLYGTMGNQQLQQQKLYNDNNQYAQGINSQIAQNNANAVNKTEGGLLNGIGSVASSFLNKGGRVPLPVMRYSSGGDVGMPSLNNSDALPTLSLGPGGGGSGDKSSGGGSSAGLGSLVGLLALASHGGKIGGKAPVKGDNVKNDIVPAMLSPGEIVIPRSASNDPKLAKEFIDHLMKTKKSGSTEKEHSYRNVLEAHRKLGDALLALQQKGGKK